MAISPPIIPQTQVLGSILGLSDDLYWEVWFRYPELFRIITCESNWRNVCNTNGCIYGQGLGQIIPSTWQRLQSVLNIGNDPLNPEDNLTASIWLYENEGTRHWGTPETSWGSYKCWNNN